MKLAYFNFGIRILMIADYATLSLQTVSININICAKIIRLYQIYNVIINIILGVPYVQIPCYMPHTDIHKHSTMSYIYVIYIMKFMQCYSG